MKNNIKNIVAALMISGLFIVPVLCFSQIGEGIVYGSNNLVTPSLNDDKSQAEVEAVEEMWALQQLNVSELQQTSRRQITFISNVISNDKSQAEVEAAEGLLYIQTISALPMLNVSDPMLVSSRQITLISNVMTADAQKSVMRYAR